MIIIEKSLVWVFKFRKYFTVFNCNTQTHALWLDILLRQDIPAVHIIYQCEKL